MNDISISIIVPIYNVEFELRRCVNSLINQTYRFIEIILVNDGSTDGSLGICEQYVNIDRRIRLINKENGGLSDARNIGVMNASGQYILFVDADDYIEQDSCERFVQIINVNSTLDILVGEAREINGTIITPIVHSNLEENKIYNNHEFLIKVIKAKEWYAPSWLNLYKREFLLKHGLFFEKGIYHEDMEILPRIFLAAERIGYSKYIFYNYIIRKNSITQKKDQSKNKADIFKIYSKWKSIYDNISDLELRKLLYANLSKHYISSCRKFIITKKEYPDGINKMFLLKNSLDIKEFIKAIYIITFRKSFVNIRNSE